MNDDEQIVAMLRERFRTTEGLVPDTPPWQDVIGSETATTKTGSPLSSHLLAATLVVAIVLAAGFATWSRQPSAGSTPGSSAAGASGVPPTTQPPTSVPTTSAAGAPTATWRRLAPAPISGRTGHSAVWSGAEMLVWGGNTWAPQQDAFIDVSDGAAYDPASDAWRRIASSPLEARSDHAAVWTGTMMLIWGGGQGDGVGAFGDGASYDPATDTWERLARSPLQPTVDPVAIWTGSDAIFMDRLSGATARYDPRSDTWSVLPPPPLPAGWRTAAMTASGVFVAAFGDGRDIPIEAAILDPVRGSWSTVSASPKSARRMTAALAAGSSVLMLSANVQGLSSGLSPGAGFDVGSGDWQVLGCGVPTSDAAWSGEFVVSASGLYDPFADRCIDIPEPPVRENGTSARESSSEVWSGAELLIWSGSTGADGAPIPGDGVGLSISP